MLYNETILPIELRNKFNLLLALKSKQLMNPNNQEFDAFLFQNNIYHILSKFCCGHMEQINHLYIDAYKKTPLIANVANNQNLQICPKARTNHKGSKLHFVSFGRNGQYIPIIPLLDVQDNSGLIGY